jgi:serine kinase
MQHAENGSILDLIHKLKRVPEPRACHLFRQILSALEYCHTQGVAHRDLKCENILLDNTFTVKLIDFGFAKCMKDTPKLPNEEKLEAIFAEKASIAKRQPKDANLSETYCGSYAYASPEILKGMPYDPFMSDVWAVGCVLFAMVFGRLPFDDRDPGKLIRVRHHADPTQSHS